MPPHTKPVLPRLAEFVVAHKQEIIAQWGEAVRHNRKIQSAEHLTYQQMVDHLPVLLDQLAEVLRQGSDGKAQGKAAQDAAEHGKMRWRQGYRIDEVIREASVIRRIILVNWVPGFGQQHRGFDGKAKKQAKRLIHQFFEDLTIASVQQYIDEVNHDRFQSIRTISHELGNLLNGISVPVNLLYANVDQSTRDWVLGVFKKNLADTQTLLNQLTDFSRLISGREQIQIEFFDLSLLCAELANTYRLLTEAKGLAFKFKCDPTLGHVASDRMRVKRIAQNLLSNALKYTDAGQICLTVRANTPEELAIIVEDTGIGIAPDELNRIFEEFHRISPRADIRGAGLGLPITKRLVELLDGRIEVSSTVGQGSRFEVILPRAHQAN